jgi:glutamate-1-semialdehyde 2,1-aminomutase
LPSALARKVREGYIGRLQIAETMKKGAAVAGLEARTKASKAYAARARRSLPGGVTAGVKYFDPYPIAMAKANGCRLWDLDGNEYVDYCLSFGPLILGHGHPRVMKAIRDSLQAAGTTMFGTPHELEATYAERLLRIFRPDGKLRFTMSGTEATIHAVRLARAYRKRPMIGKFEGHYHGGVDEFLVSHTPSREEALVPVSGSLGTPDYVLKNTLVLPFNNLPEAEKRIRGAADRLACVILEPVERSIIEPKKEFLKGLREVTASYDIPLIFDEVMSGFRTSFGGAQHTFGVTPDITCLGKIIGGGLPCGAFLGRDDILDIADPSSSAFFHSSTFAGYPMAMAAGLATLDELQRGDTMANLLATSSRMMSDLEEAIRQERAPAQILGCGSVFSILFTKERIRNYRDTLAADSERRRRLDFGLLERGIFVKPQKPFYLSTAHDRGAVTQTLDAFREVLPTLV